ncbi:MAG: acylphosphatase, partial [Patescibacteria group bacterium]
MKKRLECHIFGRVQLVMYRDFVVRKARGLGVVGEVENKEDGTVFLVGEGEGEKLLAFVEELKKGPFL